jgi:soluble lytic murein transglycosylase
MTRFSATVSFFVFCASFAPPLLVQGALAAKSHAVKPHAGKAQAAKTAKPGAAKSVAVKATPSRTAAIPLPDRNPHREALAPATPIPPDGVTGAISAPPQTGAAQDNNAAKPSAEALAVPSADGLGPEVPFPNRNPGRAAPPPSAALPAPEALAVPGADGVSSDVPFPDRNPGRAVVTPPLAAPEPAEAFEPGEKTKMDYAGILKPLLAYQLSDADGANLKDALHASFTGDDAGSRAAAGRIKDQAASKLATWFEYRNGDLDASAEAIETFRHANPEWPGQDELRERAEIALFLVDAGPDRIKAFFANSSPVSGAGKAAEAGAYLKEGNEAAARELVVSAWRDYQLNLPVEKKILDRFGSMLHTEDHQARIDKLLFPDSNATADAALRISKLLPPGEQKTIAARVAVVKRGANAGKLLAALPASATAGDVGLMYNRIQWLRRKDRDQEAWQMLLDAPSEPAKLIDLDGWWSERRLDCRIALNAGQPRIAYTIAAKHGPISGDSYVEAEFLAGWIALRFLGEPMTALEHFHALRTAAKGSKNLALAEYWLGRTSLALGDNGSALVHFHAAAKYPQYFYGQLGRQAIDAKPANLAVTPTPLPTAADIQAFLADDAVRAIGIALANDMDSVTAQFFIALSREMTNPGEVVLLLELAKLSGQPQLALRLAKIAFNRDLPVGDYALPIGVLPAFKSLLADRVDPALVHALSRQESEFNAGAKSPVGASGLMQLMPGTAKAVAKQYNIKFTAAQLINPTYNVQLGEAHLRDLIDSYSGSYFLALAAYNAGGGRVQEWMKAFGDPRDARTDPIDWIERIPFSETRDYVKKIMETLQLYRSRLAGSEKALQLVQDLNRGRAVRSKTPLSVQAKSE